jgi:hypothetical protein
MDKKEWEKKLAVYESDNKCAVCGGELETAFYADIDSFDGKTDWLSGIGMYNTDEEKMLKRCTRCGLLYAK